LRALSEPRPSIQKLRERKERHKQRNILMRAVVAIVGVVVVLAGLLLALPGVPGPGIILIAVGLGILALEFDPAERLLERILDRVEEAREKASPVQQAVLLTGGVIVAIAAAAWFLFWDVPVLPG
jgi:uncharacterized protein (TIGR02611 family)